MPEVLNMEETPPEETTKLTKSKEELNSMWDKTAEEKVAAIENL